MMLGLGSAATSLYINIPRKDPCPTGSTLFEQRDEYIGDPRLAAPQPANVCLFSSGEAREAYLKRESLVGYILPAAAAAVLLFLAFAFGGRS